MKHRVALRTPMDRWMLETRAPDPESGIADAANVTYELKTPAAKARRNDDVLNDIALMKQWAAEGKQL